MDLQERLSTVARAVVLALAVSGIAAAQSVTTRVVVAGGSATSAKIQPGGSAAIDVRLDAIAAPLIGTGFTLSQVAPAVGGFLSITARSFAGSPFDDAASGTPDGMVLAPAAALLDPASDENLGRTTTGMVGTAPATQANVLAATLTLTASAAAPLAVYQVRPTPVLSFATDASFNDYDMSAAAPFSLVVGRPLTVTKGGSGTGTVTADSGAIDCGTTCSDIYAGTLVTLTAAATPGAAFAGWSGGGCSGAGTCAVTVNAAITVTATFVANTVAPETTLGTTPPNPSNQGSGTFTFSSSVSGSTFRCSLDGAPFAICSSSHTVLVGNGTHTFAVYAVEPGGIPDPTPATYAWSVIGAATSETEPIPTTTSWTLVALALLLAAVGFARLRRRD